MGVLSRHYSSDKCAKENCDSRNIPELPKDIKASIFTQLKGFDPKMFLTHVHPAAGPDDLAYGREKLKGEAKTICSGKWWYIQMC